LGGANLWFLVGDLLTLPTKASTPIGAANFPLRTINYAEYALAQLIADFVAVVAGPTRTLTPVRTAILALTIRDACTGSCLADLTFLEELPGLTSGGTDHDVVAATFLGARLACIAVSIETPKLAGGFHRYPFAIDALDDGIVLAGLGTGQALIFRAEDILCSHVRGIRWHI